MPNPYVKNPMYALCLLAAVCVRQHVYENSPTKPLTKGVSLQAPSIVLTKPSEATLKTIIKSEKVKQDSPKKLPRPEQADSLISCVENFAKRVGTIVGDIQSTLPFSKIPESADPVSTYNVLDSILHLTSNVGSKWLV